MEERITIDSAQGDKMKNEFMKLIEKVENGQLISPILPSNIKNYLIDIDGTICDDISNEDSHLYSSAKPFMDAQKIINKWRNIK